MRTRIFGLSLIVTSLLSAAFVYAQQTADYSTPSKTLDSLTAAVEASDFGSVRSAFYVPEESADLVDALLDTFKASTRLNKVVMSKFGQRGGDGIDNFDWLSQFKRNVQQLRKGVLTINGDRATLVYPLPNEPRFRGKVSETMEFRKIDTQWKIDILAAFKKEQAKADPAEEAKRITLLRDMVKMLNTTADEVESGSLGTFEQLKQTLSQRMLALLTNAAASPSTQPAAQPTTQPVEKSGE